MHYETRYAGTEAEKDAKALADIREYLTPGQRRALHEHFFIEARWADGEAKAQLSLGLKLALGFIGVQGYPVGAAIRALEATIAGTDDRSWLLPFEDPEEDLIDLEAIEDEDAVPDVERAVAGDGFEHGAA